MGGEEGVVGGASLGGAEAFDGNLSFFVLFWLVFFSNSKKGLDPLGPPAQTPLMQEPLGETQTYSTSLL